ncbi:enoyl-CoA hydratase-related protein [Crenothrix polyspora]|uniref:Hydrogenase maturation factor HoxX n=1 Tax=Crenothrix polyspora TaxID=360316 RepID=A0A1R4HH02_9GAMM|nr:enoyl-CoA hydratase-related protein [Crenothrix polyspora]SJM95150.1 Hydrogenase maturation factor HoxX [Crenothrix polyspora]
MKILILSSTYDSLTQRLHVELTARTHAVIFDIASNDLQTVDIVNLHQPELVICPSVETNLCQSIWQHYRCITLKITTASDTGSSCLDWAIQDQEASCYVTALQITSETNASSLWASTTVNIRPTSKSSLYQLEIQDAALKVILETIERTQNASFIPDTLLTGNATIKDRIRPFMRQADRQIDWEQDSTASILNKIRAADGYPGVADNIRGIDYFIYGASEEDSLRGSPKALIAKRFGAVCRATVDGAIWISHIELKNDEIERKHFKLPATLVFGKKIKDLPDMPVSIYNTSKHTFREIWYEEHNQIGYLHFDFYDGAMSTEQCLRLRDAVLDVLDHPTRILVLLGGAAFWSSGIDLRVIEASRAPDEESWHNINALNDLILTIITATQKITIAAVHGHASAGGVALAAACDKICVRQGALLNLNYKSMGLFGSEYSTYTLPKRIGYDKTIELIENCRSLGVQEAKHIGLIDGTIPDCFDAFEKKIKIMAETLARHQNYEKIVKSKIQRRNQDEFLKPLQYYREEELQRMKEEFFEPDALYHLIRKQLVYSKPIFSKDTQD